MGCFSSLVSVVSILLQSLQSALTDVGAAVGTFELDTVRQTVSFLNGFGQRSGNGSGAGDATTVGQQLAILQLGTSNEGCPIAENPLKGEYYLPAVVSSLLSQHKARVKVLRSNDKWYGVTYKEDKPGVMAALADLREKGLYPEKLWEE